MDIEQQAPLNDAADLEQHLMRWGFTQIFDARTCGPRATDIRARAREASYDGLVLLKLPFGESAVLFRGRDVSLRRLAALFDWQLPEQQSAQTLH